MSSGGRGKHAGGDGIVKELELLEPAVVSLFADRHEQGPPGLRRGGAGKTGRATLRRDGRARRLPAKGSVELDAGDVLRVETPGGGAWGRR